MGIREAESAMTALESIECEFNYDKADYYKSKVLAFIQRKNELFPNQPALFDITQGGTELPASLNARVNKWMEMHPHYSPYMRVFAKNYLLSLLHDCHPWLYRLLAECVIQGGDFYLEEGWVYVRDAAAVSNR
jgi:hypothetical protein